MEIKGKVHCLFEQSGTFKNEFKKLGYLAYDYDIQNNFGETDYQIDIFNEIEKAYDVCWKESIFDKMTKDDLIIAFFPCIYFCATSQIAFTWNNINYKKMDVKQKTDAILERMKKREYFYSLAVKMLCIAKQRGIKLIMENPWSEQTYLKANFVLPPTLIDKNRMLRGDYYVKPTAYWFINCEPTHGESIQKDKEKRLIMNGKKGKKAGLCSEERSLISPDYARNFICDFVIGKEQKHTVKTLFYLYE